METKTIIDLVAIQCQPEVEKKFNIWYDEIHIPALLKLGEIKKVTRYKIINEAEEYPKYLTIWEHKSQKAHEAYMTSPERAAAMEETRWKGGGTEMKWRVQYELMKTWER